MDLAILLGFGHSTGYFVTSSVITSPQMAATTSHLHHLMPTTTTTYPTIHLTKHGHQHNYSRMQGMSV